MFKNIPKEMIKYDQWVCWTKEKRPINPKNSWITYASVTNSDTWGTFEQAVDAYHRLNLRGIGFVFTKADPFVGIDIDNCRNPKTGRIDAKAMLITRLLDSYTEISPSGTGLHIIVKANLPFRGKQGDLFEIYNHGRYFTMTGRHYAPTPKKIKIRYKQTYQFIDQNFPHIVIKTNDKQIIEIIKKNCSNLSVMVSPWKK